MTDAAHTPTVEEVVARVNEEAARLRGSAPPPPVAVAAASDAPVRPERLYSELMQLNDEALVRSAYRRLLGREADPAGIDRFLPALRTGRMAKLDVLVALRFSAEGKQRNVDIPGLGKRRRILRLYRLPLVGRMLEFLSVFARLPNLVREQRRHDATLGQWQDVVTAQQARLDATREELRQSNLRLEESRGPVRALETALAETNTVLGRTEDQRAHMETAQGALHDEMARLAIRVTASIGSLTRVGEHLSAVEGVVQAENERMDGLKRDMAALRQDLEQLGGTVGGFGSALNAVRQLQGEQRQALATLEGRGIPPAAEPSAEPHDSGYDAMYLEFENAFRGAYDDIKHRQSLYLPMVSAAAVAAGTDRALDLGCGRGEWLDLLSGAGYHPRGIDLNEAVVAACRARGLDAWHGDALAALAAIGDGELAVVSAFHLIEHLPTPVMLKLIDEALRVLRPGGIALFETPNARNVLVGSGDFYRDPTHRNPVFPDTLAWIGGARGFEPSRILYLDTEQHRMIPAETWKFDDLADYVRVPRDYAWIGTKPTAP